MLLNLFISTIFYTIMLAFGHMMCFIDPLIYESIPLYVIFLMIAMRFYRENCKPLEWKDFVLCALFIALIAYLYQLQEMNINGDIIAFLALAVFVPFSSFASAIRYKSLM